MSLTKVSYSMVTGASVNVFDFGAKGTGTDNDTAAIAAAVAYAATLPCAQIVFPSGSYLTDEIVIATDRTSLTGYGMVKLLARANGQGILKIAASYCSVEHFWFDNNSYTNVTALSLAPANEDDHLTRVDQLYNRIRDIHIEGCYNGVRMRCGPGTVSGDSGCWYNTIEDLDAKGTTRGIWMQPCVTNAGGGATAGSLVNRNVFKSIRCGQSEMNVGLHIEAGGTNQFYGMAFEGIQSAGPVATSTGIWIEATDSVSAFNNDGNVFFGVMNEANTQDVHCNNFYTDFFGLSSTGGIKLTGSYPQGGLSMTAAYTEPVWNGLFSNGQSGNIASGNSFNITVPPRKPCLLLMSDTNNPAHSTLWMVSGDGVNAVAYILVKDNSGGTLNITASNPVRVTVTQTTGTAANVGHGLLTGLVATI